MAQFLNPLRRRLDIVQSDTPELMQVQMNVDRNMRLAWENPLVQGNWITDIAVESAVEFSVAHGLGRSVRGYFITRTQGSNQITVREVENQQSTNTSITLVPSATGTIDLYIF